MRQRLITTKRLLSRGACREGVQEFFTEIFGPQVALSKKLALMLVESEEGFRLLKYAASFVLTNTQRITFRKGYSLTFGSGSAYAALTHKERRDYASTLAHIFNTYKR